MIIRKEQAKDYEKIYKLVKSAFENVDQSDGNEADLINELRKSDSFIPELSLVAEEDGKLLGHILFSKAKVGDCEVLALAPLSVDPSYQRQGVGKTLIEEGHRIGKDLGYPYSIVLGSDKYYPKFGYIEAKSYGIKAPFDIPSKYFMAKKLKEHPPKIAGLVSYDKAFNS